MAQGDDRQVTVPLEMIRLLPDRAVGEFLALGFTAKACQGERERLAFEGRLGTWSRLLTAAQFAALIDALDVGRQREQPPKPAPNARKSAPAAAPPDQRSSDEHRRAVLACLSVTAPKSAECVRAQAQLTPEQTKGLLKRLLAQGAIKTTGKGRGVRYALAAALQPDQPEAQP